MTASATPSLWNLAANPVFRRHAAARLRPVRLTIWIVVSQIIAAFFWCITALLYLRLNVREPENFSFGSTEFHQALQDHGSNAFLVAWLAVLVIQGLLVVIKGTFSVATGVAREANEGMMESIRLTPIPDGQKVLGQLLGLPLLETVVAASLLIWALLSAWLGHLPFLMMFRIYLILATSTLFHHAIGLVAGTLIRQKILAGTLSQILIILIHFILPTVGGFGIGLISHLGAESAIISEILKAKPELVTANGTLSPSSIQPPVDFFKWQISVSGYHWIVTVSALATLLTILVRRWNDRDSQLLGKIGTLLFTVWLLLLGSGEVLPTFWRGDGLEQAKSLSFIKMSIHFQLPDSNSFVVPGWIIGFTLGLGLLNLLLSTILIPSTEARARQRHLPQARWWSDGAFTPPWTIVLAVLFSIAWFVVVHALLTYTPNLPFPPPTLGNFLWILSSLLIPSLTWHTLVTSRGWKTALCCAFMLWIVPLMISIVGLLLSAHSDGWPKWLASLSGIILPGYATLDSLHSATACSLALHLITLIVLTRNPSSTTRSSSQP